MLTNLASGAGTSGCVIAGRLAENTNSRILLVEAGPHNKDLENVHMVGGERRKLGRADGWSENITKSGSLFQDGRRTLTPTPTGIS